MCTGERLSDSAPFGYTAGIVIKGIGTVACKSADVSPSESIALVRKGIAYIIISVAYPNILCKIFPCPEHVNEKERPDFTPTVL